MGITTSVRGDAVILTLLFHQIRQEPQKFGAKPGPEPITVAEEAAQAVRAMIDGWAVLQEESDEDTANGCPHDHPECEGADADGERPVLCWSCWDKWAGN